MTEDEARTLIELKTQWDADPALTEDEVDELVVLARRPDKFGLVYTDAGWTEAYDTDDAAAEGWRWKAGKKSGEFSFNADGQAMNRSEVVLMCLDMSKRYARKSMGSVALFTSG